MGGPLENEADKKMRMEASGVRGVQRGGCWAFSFEVVVQHYLRLDEVQTEWGEEQAIQRLDVSVVAEELIVVRKNRSLPQVLLSVVQCGHACAGGGRYGRRLVLTADRWMEERDEDEKKVIDEEFWAFAGCREDRG